MSEEIVEDDPVAEEETELVSEEDSGISVNQDKSTDIEIEELARTNQLSGDEEVIGMGSDIIVEKQPDETEEEHYKRVLKYCFPETYKRRYGNT